MARKNHSHAALTGVTLAIIGVVALGIALLIALSSTTSPAPADATLTPQAGLDLGQLNALDQITAAPTPTPSMAEIMTFFADDDPALGPADAPVVIVEFSDYLCPFCGVWYLTTLPRILAAYPDQVRFVHRDAPVLDQTISMQAALAAGCAEAQDAFWPMHDALFAPYTDFDLAALQEAKANPNADRDSAGRQAHLDGYSADNLRAMAEAVGLDLATYETCMAGSERATEVAIDLQTAYQLGISGVPAYIVNGRLVSGARSFEDFTRIIDTALSERPITG